MKITKIKYYGGAQDKVCRLGISHLFLELQKILLDTEVRLLEKKMVNGGAVISKALDAKFKEVGEWIQGGSGEVDWIKRIRYNQSILARIGVEIQISSRSDLTVRDLIHLRNNIRDGVIDVGVIVLPDIKLHYFLPDRSPSFRDAERYIEEEFVEVQQYPLVIIAIEHDGPSDTPLPKQKRKS